MTLRSRLLIAILVVFFLVFSGLLFLSVHTTRNYLQQQLASHAQDAATSLSYPLTEALANNDMMLADAQVSAMFDRGYYQRITVRSAGKKDLIDKVMPLRIEHIPTWFTGLFPLETQPGEAFVSSGWRQLGKVIVISQPTFAYEHLWNSLVEMAGWMCATLVLALLLMTLLLRIILKPMHHIEAAALAIRDKRFVQIPVLPKARELRRVVVAMNDMSRRAAETLDSEIKRAEDFRRQAYVDSLTGLENRLGFDMRLDQLLEEPDKFQLATLMLLELDGLKEANAAGNYQQGDLLLTNIVRSARELLGDSAEILSRSGSASFAFLFLDLKEAEGNALANKLQQRVLADLTQAKAGTHVSFSLGCAVFRAGDTHEGVLSRADLAVETARQARRNSVAFINADAPVVNATGSAGWRQMIQNALTEDRWALLVQPVVALRDRAIFHHEVMSKLIDNQGNPVSAAQFMPMALRHNLMVKIDQALVTLIIDYLERQTDNGVGNVAVNISAQAIDSAEFNQWLKGKLKWLRHAKRLSFEVSEFGCTRKFEATRKFATLVRNSGSKFGIDQFGLEPGSLNALRYFPPDYIKLDGRLVREATSADGNREHLQAIVRLAGSLEIPVIAQNVETEAMVELLLADKVQSGQGYYFGAPERL